MNLVNIFNHDREITLFCRNDNGDLEIKVVKDFFPYFYEKSFQGNFKSYKGDSLQKMFVSRPRDIMKQRSNEAWEADLLFPKRYIIDKIDKFDKCPIKYAFIDIEVQSDELPNVQLAEKPVSCITVYNSFTKEYKSFYSPNYNSEYEMLESFIEYLQKEKFDLWLSWHVGFDYNYLYNRVPDFAKKISPIGKTRYGGEDISYPAGISIVDYLSWFKKVTLNKEQQYTLDYIAEKHLGKGKEYSKVDFSKISEEIRKRNIEDVKIMVELEKKFKLIPYYDEVRRLAKVEWEDLIWNSRTIDMLLLQEAKNQNVVLPMKPKDNEKEDFLGAYREAYGTGAFYNIGKYDLSSAYPFAIINFCLDPANIVIIDHPSTSEIINHLNTQEIKNISESELDQAEKELTKGLDIIEINKTVFRQNENALLPTVVKRMIILKNNIKSELKKYPLESPEYKDTKTKYDAIKSIVNSCYGVMGNRFFRLYDKRVASATTFIVRELLHYVKDNIEAKGYKVIYVDTDAVFIDSKENLTDFLNDLIQKWAKIKYSKEHVDIEFEYKGSYTKLLILAKCRYIGYLKTEKGTKEEVKGVEAKRKDSTTFMKKFQRTLIDKILDKEPKKKIIQWIKNQVKEFEKAPIADIAFPCKLARKPEEYKNVPIFLKALQCTPNFSKKVGNAFYYIYMQPFGYEQKIINQRTIMTYDKNGNEKGFKNLTLNRLNKAIDVIDLDLRNPINGKELDEKERLEKLMEKGLFKIQKIKTKGKIKNVLAFDDDEFKHIDRSKIDWEIMIQRNLKNKYSIIFKAMDWEDE